jgi:hypothetical protein
MTADALIAPNVDVLNVLVRLQCRHKFLHLFVGDCIVAQVNVLDAREFTNKLCQEI